jgi:hypothetical protein
MSITPTQRCVTVNYTACCASRCSSPDDDDDDDDDDVEGAPVHASTVYSFTPNLGPASGRKFIITRRPFYFQGITQVPVEQETEWAPQPAWTFWKREKSPDPAGIRTPDCPASSPVTIQTALSQLQQQQRQQQQQQQQ